MMKISRRSRALAVAAALGGALSVAGGLTAPAQAASSTIH
jgi:hypothetical protein